MKLILNDGHKDDKDCSDDYVADDLIKCDWPRKSVSFLVLFLIILIHVKIIKKRISS